MACSFVRRITWHVCIIGIAHLSAGLPGPWLSQCLAAPQAGTTHAAPYEHATDLRASEILPPHLTSGPHHTVQQRVTNDGYCNTYEIASPFGTFRVEGQPLLEIRIGEMNALAELDKLSSSSVFADAAYKAGKGIVMAPVNIVKKTARTVSDPDKMADTLAAVPEGAEKLFSWVYRKGKSAASSVGDAFAPSATETPSPAKPKQSEKSTAESVGATLDQGASLGLKYLGYTKRQRQWFRKLQVNPYTSNELLRDEVMRVAGIETAVGTAFKFVPGLGLLGELSTFNTWYERAEKLSLYEDPDSISKKNGKELLALGVSSEQAQCLLEHNSYSPWTKRFIAASLTSIGARVTGHAEFIRAACQAKNEPSAMYFVSVAEHLEKLHASVPLKRIVASTYLPAALLSDGSLYLPLSVDYLFWTKEVAGIIKDFQEATTRVMGAKRLTVAIRGKASPKARRELAAIGAKVSEGWPST